MLRAAGGLHTVPAGLGRTQTRSAWLVAVIVHPHKAADHERSGKIRPDLVGMTLRGACAHAGRLEEYRAELGPLPSSRRSRISGELRGAARSSGRSHIPRSGCGLCRPNRSSLTTGEPPVGSSLGSSRRSPRESRLPAVNWRSLAAGETRVPESGKRVPGERLWMTLRHLRRRPPLRPRRADAAPDTDAGGVAGILPPARPAHRRGVPW